MSQPRAVLRQPESYPESRLPPDVQALQRPTALGRAVELALLRWESGGWGRPKSSGVTSACTSSARPGIDSWPPSTQVRLDDDNRTIFHRR